MKTEFYEVLKELRESSSSEAEKGRRFEELMVQFFRADPVYRDIFRWVKRWGVWEDRPHSDIGVDIVAEVADGGGLYLMQCKFFSELAKLKKSDIEGFIAASGKQPFKTRSGPKEVVGRIFIHTADETSIKNVANLIAGHTPHISILTSADLASRDVSWPELAEPAAQLEYIGEKYKLRDHQKEARDVVLGAFNGMHPGSDDIEKGKAYDRGKMIMACGTGKTFTSLKIAEEYAGKKEAGAGGRVLYLVPSISLLQQTMREWAEQKSMEHSYIGICSDKQAGKTDEDQNMFELEIPVTTDPQKISEALSIEKPNSMRVVFCTYQSIDLVKQAQDAGAPEFDIVFADEAHRTTGLEKLDSSDEEQTSVFVRIHDENYIKAKKRLYMTATSRVYTDALKQKADQKNYGIFSMDEEDTYGPEIYSLKFSEAIDEQLLSDYKVIIIGVDEDYAAEITEKGNLVEVDEKAKLDLDEAAKIIGCAKALAHPETDETGRPVKNQRQLSRAIAFCNTIKYSKTVGEIFELVTDTLKSGGDLDSDQAQIFSELNFEVSHVDGTTNALARKQKIDWLKRPDKKSCNILSNARCLTEGVDVPALDATIFLSPRNSFVDIIQAVGRVMRKSEGKDYGYIILPILFSATGEEDPASAIERDERYKVIWRVLQALRSHDERLNIDINSENFGKIKVCAVGPEGEVAELGSEASEQMRLAIDDKDFLDAIHTRIIDKVGNRRYWEHWAKDVADIALRIIARINALLDIDEKAKGEFEKFLKDLQKVVSPALESDDAVNMLAQHLITAPVFEALFKDYDFAGSNPVSKAMSKMVAILDESGLAEELKTLNKFYDDVRQRASAFADKPEKRQELIKDLYERFFQTAFKKDADRLGIVYTPIEIVDFILHSADYALRQEFGRGLSDEGVDIIEPFVGTGTFITRLLQSDLIKDKDLERKFRNEIHANELLLLAYYIAAVNTEEAYHFRRPGADYEPFEGIVLRDTFLAGDRGSEESLLPEYFPINSERAERQDAKDIQVIIGNPPWSAWQKSAVEKNPNNRHLKLEQKIIDTYVEESSAQLPNSLYDSYVKAIRWATDRIDEKEGGIIAFVSNGGWLDGRAADGLRAYLAKDFTNIYCFNLRGNIRQFDKKEGDNVFGSGSMATVAITLFVKNPKKRKGGDCKIYYKDIGDYLKRKEKLGILRSTMSIEGVDDWQLIKPDKNNDWLNKKDPKFQAYLEIGSANAKFYRKDNTIFRNYCSGIKTNRDAWAYDSSYEKLEKREREAVTHFNIQLDNNRIKNPEENLKIIKWHATVLNSLSKYATGDQRLKFDSRLMRKVVYRPFFPQWLYYERVLNNAHYRVDEIFPGNNFKNLVTNIVGRGRGPFSTIMLNLTADLNLDIKAGGGATIPQICLQAA